MAAQTHEYFHTALSSEEWKVYLGSKFHLFSQYIPTDNKDIVQASKITDGANNETVVLPWLDRRPRSIVTWLVNLGHTSLAVLSLDFLLRLLFCPGARHFCTDFINIADAIALLASIVKSVIDGVNPENRFHASLLDTINVLQLLRILRFLRPMSKVVGFRVLYFTLRSSCKELLLLLGLVLFLVMTFASLLYYADDRTTMKSIPDAMWYALVTMTTVGYGDIVPTSIQTKIIGSACAVVGVGVISMTMPVIVGSFLDFYNHSIILAFSSKQRKKKKEEAVCVVGS
ncbi:hypothetical protein C0Q70_02470 [Pomacea canaliculata]|uniref:Ion transport domain-containing protein n=1 Tax=Pomacea canaliculata TaxID=400727 RepID=A0A2T7PQ56_POMCA|nr:hypothetical protein C0Q70_02470 [Pomacea canaliculata]